MNPKVQKAKIPSDVEKLRSNIRNREVNVREHRANIRDQEDAIKAADELIEKVVAGDPSLPAGYNVADLEASKTQYQANIRSIEKVIEQEKADSVTDHEVIGVLEERLKELNVEHAVHVRPN